jgi:hypothetical protein
MVCDMTQQRGKILSYSKFEGHFEYIWLWHGAMQHDAERFPFALI